jgi:histidinol-phosphate aminotransferase
MTGPRPRPELAEIPGYVPGRPAGQAAGGPAWKLSSNENPYSPLPGVLAAAVEAAGSMNRYPDLTASRLVAAIADRLGVPLAHVATGTGSVGVLQQIVQAVAGAGDEVVFAWRSFEAYPIVVPVCGARAVPVPLTRDERHDLPAMAAAVTPATRLVLLCTPNNPTGTVIRQAELDAFLDDVPDDVLVVVDEAYVEFVRDPDAADGLATYRDRPNIAVLRTFSKAYGLAGLRVGYAVAHPPVAEALRKTAVPFGVNVVAQHAAVASLAAAAELLARVDALVAERRRVAAALARQGWTVPPTEANFVWLRLGSQTARFAAACDAAGVTVRAYGDDGVRVTVGEQAANDAFLSVAAGWEPADRRAG